MRDRESIVNRTLRWLDEQTVSPAECRALRQLWSNHGNKCTFLFRGCRTQTDVLEKFGDEARLDAEQWIGPRTVQHLQRLVARAVMAEVRRGE